MEIMKEKEIDERIHILDYNFTIEHMERSPSCHLKDLEQTKNYFRYK